MKKFMSIILSLAALLAIMPCAFAAETISADSKFIDVPADAWYLDDLNYAIANGYIAGTGDNTFSPDGVLTRGQFVTILGRMLEVSTTDGTTKFEDVSTTSYYAPYVGWASKQGYVNGITDTMFYPDSYLTVEQMGTIFSNYISKTGVVLIDYTPSDGYKDAASISLWAQSSMETMKQYGLLVTDADGRVNPSSQVTRANGAVSLVRLARGMRLGEPVTVIQPSTPQAPTQPTDKVTYGSLIKGDQQLITRHEYDDMDAIDNNIRYMLKNGICAIRLDVTDLARPTNDAYCTRYMSVLNQYPEFGYNAVSYLDGDGEIIWIYNGFYGEGDLFNPSEGPSDSAMSMVNDYNSRFGKGQFYSYRDTAFSEAVKVHDEMWASGAITSAMTQKEKAKVYFDWVVKHCDYDHESNVDSFVPYGVFNKGKAVCQGYTGAYNLLLKLEGIDCSTDSTLDHIWTVAILDGVVYHIDATWGDQNNVPANNYFCMTEDAAWARFGGKDMWSDVFDWLGWEF